MLKIIYYSVSQLFIPLINVFQPYKNTLLTCHLMLLLQQYFWQLTYLPQMSTADFEGPISQLYSNNSNHHVLPLHK